MICSTSSSGRRIAPFLALLAVLAPFGARSEPAASPRVAMFPLENLTDRSLPEAPLLSALDGAVARAGIDTVSDEVVVRFLASHRFRTFGVDAALAASAREELAVDAILIVSVERRLPDVPMLALTARLVSVREEPRVVWVDTFARAGAEGRGLLGLGGTTEIADLERMAARRITSSLQEFLKNGRSPPRCSGRGFGPQVAYRPGAASRPVGKRVVVLPFFNETRQPSSGDRIALQFIRQFSAGGKFEVIEPGVVRAEQLRQRIVTRGGVAIDEARRIAESVQADLVVFGEIRKIEEDTGQDRTPEVDFTVFAVGRDENLVWQSASHATGADRVVLFDFGRVSTSSELACRMASRIVSSLPR